MRGRKANQERDVKFLIRLHDPIQLQLFGDGKKREHIESIVLRLVPQVRDSLLCQRVIFTVPENTVRLNAGPGIRLDQSGREEQPWCLDGFIAVIHRNNHGMTPPIFLLYYCLRIS